MTTPDLERALAETLHRHAEDAMNQTDTRHEYERLEDRLDVEQPRRRRRVLAGGLVATAALTAAALWTADLDPGGTTSDPVGPSIEQAPAERVADEFFAAMAAGDTDLAASYLAPGASTWRTDWESQLRWDTAWHMEYLPQPCQELSTSPAGANVVCPFGYYALGSDRLGLEPFGRNTMSLRISDGQVVSVEPVYNDGSNGEAELHQAIGAWVRENHPGDWRFMATTEGYTRAEMARWFSLWEQRIDEYVAFRLQ